MQASRKNLRYSHPVFLSFEFSMDALEESAKFFDIAFRYKFNASGIFNNLHFLARTKIQCLPDCFGYNDLIFG